MATRRRWVDITNTIPIYLRLEPDRPRPAPVERPPATPDAFALALLADPGNLPVLADWLEEKGDPLCLLYRLRQGEAPLEDILPLLEGDPEW